ncbi:MAG: hypothetical protein II795_02315 [Firmicutes bacterium]|nr:hypothetical protein [Bacillota bacterium]
MENENNDPVLKGDKVTENIWRCPDGIYRWTYEYNMKRNPTILFTVWRVMGIAIGAVYLFILILNLFAGSLKSLNDLWQASKIIVLMIGIFFVLSIISYLILAALYGWKYQVLFEMTDTSVTHIQMPKQFKKTEAIGWLTMLAGVAAKKPYMVGLGLNVAAKNSSTSEFKNVETVKVRRKRNTIHVNQLLDKNQVYAEDADFDFVEKFITERCTKAKFR